MTNLREKIAAAVARELVRQAQNCGEYQIRDCYEVADAVILALGLKRASRPSDYEHVNYPPGYQYITDWIDDE